MIRLKEHGEEEAIRETYAPPCNWDFYQTASWINFYLGRDHVGKRLGVLTVPLFFFVVVSCVSPVRRR